jgi:hypothetical protein
MVPSSKATHTAKASRFCDGNKHGGLRLGGMSVADSRSLTRSSHSSYAVTSGEESPRKIYSVFQSAYRSTGKLSMYQEVLVRHQCS